MKEGGRAGDMAQEVASDAWDCPLRGAVCVWVWGGLVRAYT